MEDNGEWHNGEQKWRMTDNGQLQIMGIIHNWEWQTMMDDRQWWAIDNGEWKIIDGNRQWWTTEIMVTYNGKWQIMVKDGQTMVVYIGGW